MRKKYGNYEHEEYSYSPAGIVVYDNQEGGIVESTKKKTKSKFCNKKTSIGFILNMIAVCLGVLLAFFLQDCWHKSIDAKNTERILTMTYQELLNNGDYYTALYDNYSILKSVGLVKAKLSSEFAVELLR